MACWEDNGRRVDSSAMGFDDFGAGQILPIGHPALYRAHQEF